MENNINNVMQKSNRDAQYELIRVLSIMLVLLVHINSTYSNPDSFFAGDTLIRQILSATFICCNGLFFILSGRFALKFDETKSSYKDYYFKKVIYLLLPMLFYMTIETVTYYIQNPTGNLVKTLFVNITNEYTIRHYWFMFTIIFDLMVAPIVAKYFRNMSDRMMFLFLAIGILHLTLISYSPLVASEKLTYDSPFDKFHFHFFLGGIIDRVINYFGKKRLILVGMICFVVARIQVMKLGYADYTNDVSPLYLFSVIAMWIVICETYKLIGNKFDKVILFLGKYSFQIYLIHFMLLDILVSKKMQQVFTDYPFYLIGSFVVLFSISLLLAILIDLLLLKPMQKGMNFGYKKLIKNS